MNMNLWQSVCAKCGSFEKRSVEYCRSSTEKDFKRAIESRSILVPTGPEYMLMTCICGYKWRRDPIDAKGEEKA